MYNNFCKYEYDMKTFCSIALSRVCATEKKAEKTTKVIPVILSEVSYTQPAFD